MVRERQRLLRALQRELVLLLLAHHGGLALPENLRAVPALLDFLLPLGDAHDFADALQSVRTRRRRSRSRRCRRRAAARRRGGRRRRGATRRSSSSSASRLLCLCSSSSLRLLFLGQPESLAAPGDARVLQLSGRVHLPHARAHVLCERLVLLQVLRHRLLARLLQLQLGDLAWDWEEEILKRIKQKLYGVIRF